MIIYTFLSIYLNGTLAGSLEISLPPPQLTCETACHFAGGMGNKGSTPLPILAHPQGLPPSREKKSSPIKHQHPSAIYNFTSRHLSLSFPHCLLLLRNFRFQPLFQSSQSSLICQVLLQAYLIQGPERWERGQENSSPIFPCAMQPTGFWRV